MKHMTKTYILTGLTCIGVIGSSVLSVRQTLKAEEILDKYEKCLILTKEDKVRLTWKCYIPVVAVNAFTIAVTIANAVMNRNMVMALTGAYATLEQMYTNYKNSVIDLYGEDAHKQIVAHIIEEKGGGADLYAPGIAGNYYLGFEDPSVKHLYYFDAADRFFVSTNEEVMEAEYHINRNLLLRGYISLDEALEFFGVEPKPEDTRVGWTTCNGDYYWLDFSNYKTDELEIDNKYAPDGIVRVISPMFIPTPDYDEVY